MKKIGQVEKDLMTEELIADLVGVDVDEIGQELGYEEKLEELFKNKYGFGAEISSLQNLFMDLANKIDFWMNPISGEKGKGFVKNIVVNEDKNEATRKILFRAEKI